LGSPQAGSSPESSKLPQGSFSLRSVDLPRKAEFGGLHSPPILRGPLGEARTLDKEDDNSGAEARVRESAYALDSIYLKKSGNKGDKSTGIFKEIASLSEEPQIDRAILLRRGYLDRSYSALL